MKYILGFILVIATASAFADTYVRGYTKKDGTYVQPHYRSSPNSTTLDNYSTKGNVNPYTGQRGYKAPEPSYGVPTYQYNPPSADRYRSYGSGFND